MNKVNDLGRALQTLFHSTCVHSKKLERDSSGLVGIGVLQERVSGLCGVSAMYFGMLRTV